jgi:hypothetical protein
MTQAQGVYCAVQTGSLSVIYVNIIRSSGGVHFEETIVNALIEWNIALSLQLGSTPTANTHQLAEQNSRTES